MERTGAATSKRTAKKAARLEDLRQFINDVYAAADRSGLALRAANDRRPLPFPKDVLYKVFCQHKKHEVASATFESDLKRIGVKVTSGPKRWSAKQLAEMLA